MSTIDLNRVRLFVRVAEAGSFTGAAPLRAADILGQPRGRGARAGSRGAADTADDAPTPADGGRPRLLRIRVARAFRHGRGRGRRVRAAGCAARAGADHRSRGPRTLAPRTKSWALRDTVSGGAARGVAHATDRRSRA